MRILLLSLVTCSFVTLKAQVLVPSSVVYHRLHAIKEVEKEVYSDQEGGFIAESRMHYNRKGFLIMHESFREGAPVIYYDYDYREEDSVILVKVFEDWPETSSISDKTSQVLYRYKSGSLIEFDPANSQADVKKYIQYLYDGNWNLTGKVIFKVSEGDSVKVLEENYIVQTDARNQLLKSRQSREDVTVYYAYGDGGRILSRMWYDGPVKRSTEHRIYHEDDLYPEMCVQVNKRSAGLTSLTRFHYDHYWWSRPGILERWQPVGDHPPLIPPR